MRRSFLHHSAAASIWIAVAANAFAQAPKQAGEQAQCATASSVRRCFYSGATYGGAWRSFDVPWCGPEMQICWPICCAKKLAGSRLVERCPGGCLDDGTACVDPKESKGCVEFTGTAMMVSKKRSCDEMFEMLKLAGQDPCATPGTKHYRDQARACLKTRSATAIRAMKSY